MLIVDEKNIHLDDIASQELLIKGVSHATHISYKSDSGEQSSMVQDDNAQWHMVIVIS